ncbi:acyltransferase [Solihabitans fulvus]|uniref:Acyltransferase n=1 Tax=Solihabitans fulvus TaxID=1892852 RepID=A0A5B2XKQ5_9PSEU|nr:acyltransferase [Solihabitans fulvus]KAA2263695.1 acyltransferase [Solihabitans fulvus]
MTVERTPLADFRTPAARGRLYGLDVLRVVASVVVVYTHLAAWFHAGNYRWRVGSAVTEAVVDPLHLNANLGFVGVSTFLLLSGLVVTSVAFRESPGEFFVRRIVRIVPALWGALAVAFVLVKIDAVPTMATQDTATAGQLLSNLWLGNYGLPDQNPLLPVTWTLTVQIAFYAFTALSIPLLRRRPWLPAAIAATGISLTVSAVHLFDTPFPLLVRTIVSFLPVVFLGQVISLARERRIRPATAVALGIVHFLLFVRADLTTSAVFDGDGYQRTLLITVLVVLLGMAAGGRLARSGLVQALSRRTYAVYLVHMPACYAVLTLLTPRIGVTWSTLAALAATVAATEVLHRFVEEPANRLFRRWLRRRPPGIGKDKVVASVPRHADNVVTYGLSSPASDIRPHTRS